MINEEVTPDKKQKLLTLDICSSEDEASHSRLLKPLSVWDRMVNHDTELFKKEQECKRKKQKEDKNALKKFLEAQMNEKQEDLIIKDHIIRIHDKKIIDEAVRKLELREAKRKKWLKEQGKTSHFLN